MKPLLRFAGLTPTCCQPRRYSAVNMTCHTIVDRDRGLPSSQVHRMAHDSCHRVWMAGPSGLCCYDGSRVRTFDKRQGLRCAGLRTVAVAADDTVWIGTDLGVEAFDATGRPLTQMPPAAWPFGLVDCVATGTDGVWLGTSQGLVELIDPHLSCRTGAHVDVGYVRDLLHLGGGRYAAVAASGLHLLNEGVWRQVPLPPTLAPPSLRRVASDGEGGLVVAAAHSLWLLDSEGRTRGEVAPVPGDSEVGALRVHGADIWVGVGHEVLCYRHGSKGRLAEVSRSSAGSKVNDLLLDGWGNVWVATDTAGVSRLSCLRQAVQRIAVPSAAYVLRADAQGGIRVGGDGFTASLANDGDTVWARTTATLPSTVWDLLADGTEGTEGACWLATHAGLFRMERAGDTPQRCSPDGGLLSAPCRVLLKRGNTLFIGTLAGLVRLQDGRSEAVTGADGLSLGYVYNLQLDSEQRLWVGTLGRGLWREGLAGLAPVLGGLLSATANTYVVAMGPLPGQVLVVQDENVLLLQGAAEPRLLSREYPNAGWTALWLDERVVAIGTDDGLRLIDGDSGAELRRINVLYDAAVWEFTNNRALLRGRDGRLYCGLNGGLMVVDLQALGLRCTPPSAQLSQLVWHGAEARQADGWTTVDPGKWSLEVEVYAAWMLDEQRVEFRYRLAGFEPEWSTPTRRPTIRYSSLPPGEYLLQVQAQAPLSGPGPVRTLLRLRVRQGVLQSVARAGAAAYDRMFGLALRNRRLLRRHGELEAEVAARRKVETALQEHQAGLEELVQVRTRELIAARDDALSANQAKSQFLSRMSHELRTPMNAILGFAQLMDMDADLQVRHRRFVNEMLAAGRHLLALINDVLDLAQVEAGAMALRVEVLALETLVGECLQMVMPAALKQGISLSCEDLRGPRVMADRTRLRQVMLNLLSNAIKYNRPGGNARVELEPADTGWVRLCVVDDGPGIALQRQAELFQPFNRLGAEFSDVEGTGIGLAIVRQVVDRMGGRVGVQSRVGMGSRFWIELPLAAVADGTVVASTGPETAQSPRVTHQSRVLYVEDNAANRMLMQHVVERHPGVQLLLASTGQEGLALARSERPDLVLLDLQLPDQDGYEVLRKLKAEANMAGVPVVAMTAFAMAADRDRTHQAGFVEHVSKPVEIGKIDLLLARWLPQHAATTSTLRVAAIEHSAG